MRWCRGYGSWGRTLLCNVGKVRAPSRRSIANVPEPRGGEGVLYRDASPGIIIGRKRMKSKEKDEEDKE